MISRRAMMNDKIVSQSGDTLLLEECKGSYLNGLRVFGKSTQFTTTGAQLIDLSDQIGRTETKNGATYKINDDQSITVSGKPTEYTSFFIKVMTLKAGTYFLNNEASDKNIFIQLIGNGINEGVFTLDEDLLNVGIYVVFNVAENNTKRLYCKAMGTLHRRQTISKSRVSAGDCKRRRKRKYYGGGDGEEHAKTEFT